MSDTLTPAAAATAEWWADKIFGGIPGSTGDGMADMLALVAGAQGRPAEPGKRGDFTAALTAHLVVTLAGDSKYGITLSTDYGPEGMLATLADRLGVRGFPFKTMSNTYPTHVTAALGYGASPALIWQAEEWERPICNQAKYGESEREPWRCSALVYHAANAHVFDIPDPLCAAQIDRFGRPETCGRSSREGIHDIDSEDAWTASHAHPFATASMSDA